MVIDLGSILCGFKIFKMNKLYYLSNNKNINKHKKNMNKNKLISEMVKELQMNFEDYDDCGEVNHTKLSENMAEEHNIYVDEIDYEIPEYVFEAAVIAAEKYENQQ